MDKVLPVVRLPVWRVVAGFTASLATVSGAFAAADGPHAARAMDQVTAAATAPPSVAADLEPQSPYVRAAGACPGLDPALLVAIHGVETSGDLVGRPSSAGAVGPMQFLPSTWAHYGRDGDGDGRVEATDFDDALAGAVGLLCANGAGEPGQVRSAVWNYNHSWAYVSDVVDRAAAVHRASLPGE